MSVIHIRKKPKCRSCSSEAVCQRFIQICLPPKTMNNKKKILTVVGGARPQFIKASVVSNVLENLDEVQEVIVNSGQHYIDYNMSQQFFNELLT